MTRARDIADIDQELSVADSPTFGGLTVSNTEANLYLEDSNDPNTAFTRLYSYSGIAIMDVDPNNNGGSASSFRVSVDGSEAMRVIGGGNVGIGTSLPAQALHVQDPGTDAAGTIQMGTDYHGYVQQLNNNLNIISNGDQAYRAALGTNNGTGNIVFQTASGTTGNTERMRLDSSGRVTTPFQPHWHGGITNTNGTGVANASTQKSSRGGLTFVTDRVTVPVAGVYSIHFNTISDSTTGARADAVIVVNGLSIVSMLHDAATGFHYKSGSLNVLLAASDYVQFANADWYLQADSSTNWKSASVTLIG